MMDRKTHTMRHRSYTTDSPPTPAERAAIKARLRRIKEAEMWGRLRPDSKKRGRFWSAWRKRLVEAGSLMPGYYIETEKERLTW